MVLAFSNANALIVGKIILILLVNQIKMSTNLLYQFVLKMLQTFFFFLGVCRVALTLKKLLFFFF